MEGSVKPEHSKEKMLGTSISSYSWTYDTAGRAAMYRVKLKPLPHGHGTDGGQHAPTHVVRAHGQFRLQRRHATNVRIMIDTSIWERVIHWLTDFDAK